MFLHFYEASIADESGLLPALRHLDNRKHATKRCR